MTKKNNNKARNKKTKNKKNKLVRWFWDVKVPSVA